MSIHLMALVWERAPYDGGTLLALLALADWANDEGLTWPSVAQIASKSRMQIRNAQYILRTLEGDGMLTREQHGSGRATTVYRINVAALGAMPVVWKRPSATPSLGAAPEPVQDPGSSPVEALIQGHASGLREQNGNAPEFAPMQNLHDAPQCTPGMHHSAPQPRNDCTPGMHPSAPLGCTTVHPIRHRSVIEPSGDPPTPAELGHERSADGAGGEQNHWTPRELETNPRALGTNPRANGVSPRQMATQAKHAAIAACPYCDTRGLLELRDEGDLVVIWRCPHVRDAIASYTAPRGLTWPHAPPQDHGPAP